MAEPSLSDLERLLEVQAHDTHADQLRHRRATLPERGALSAAEAAQRRIDEELTAVAHERDQLAREQRREEDEVASFEDRITKADRQLYSGTVTNPRELQALQADIESLQRHKSQHEDAVLDVMERIEPLQASLGALQRRRTECAETVSSAADALAVAEAEVDAELGEVEAARASTVEGLGGALLDEYTRLRSLPGGVAIARLVGNRCEGCHLTLSAVEVDRLRHLPAGELAHCEECGRMLVV